jgi:hypothetical protein
MTHTEFEVSFHWVKQQAPPSWLSETFAVTVRPIGEQCESCWDPLCESGTHPCPVRGAKLRELSPEEDIVAGIERLRRGDRH